MFTVEELQIIAAALRIMRDIDAENGHVELAEFSERLIQKIQAMGVES